jgi:hypothetical protein
MEPAPLPERVHWDGSNINTKHYTTISKEGARNVRATTQKTNKIKYHEVSTSCLYLITN